MGLFWTSNYNIGFKGMTDEVRARARVSQPYTRKLKVLEGCVAACQDKRHSNLRAFFQSYIDHKISLGHVEGSSLSINDGSVRLLAEPFLNLTEKSFAPALEVELLTRGMTPFQKSAILGLALDVSHRNGTWPKMHRFLEEHIDIDDTGYNGPAKKVRARAMLDIGWTYKAPVIEGCLRALHRPEHLKAFIAGYLEFKRSNGSIEKIRTGSMDEGIENLFAKPLVGLLEKNKAPAEAVRNLLSDLNDYYRQTALDLLLREATDESNSWFVTAALLDAGADPNADGGRPLANALNKGDEKIITLLYRFGADFDTIPAFAKEEDRGDYAVKAAEWKNRLAGKSIPSIPANTDISPPSKKISGKGPYKFDL